MIDWDISYIQELEDHYNEIFEEHLNLVYFTNNFENIYRLTIRDKFLLPDLFHDVMLYTFNGINARDKMMYSEKELEILEKNLKNFSKRVVLGRNIKKESDINIMIDIIHIILKVEIFKC